MRFQVPQFIEVEDKIFGPLTLKQFIYLAGGAGLSFVIYVVLKNNIFLAAVPIIIVMGISATFAFYKLYNVIPFIKVAETAFKYYAHTKLFIWKKVEEPAQPITDVVKDAQKYASIMVPKISDSKLKDLTWSLDIKESMYSNKNQK